MSFPASFTAAAQQIGAYSGSQTGQNEVELLTQILIGQIAGLNNPSGGSGITQLTGDVTAGPGSGSVASLVTQITGFTGINVSAPGGALQSILITGANNAAALSVVGGSITGSGTTGFASITGTWNTSGSPTAFNINVTNTASGGASMLQTWQASGVNVLGLRVDGLMKLGGPGVNPFMILAGNPPQMSMTSPDTVTNYLNMTNDTFGTGRFIISSQGISRIQFIPAGGIVLASLPTSDPGVSGQLYKSAGVVMQSA